MKWSLIAQILNVSTTVATTMVLARLLDPTMWGLVGMALVILRFGQYFARMGVGSALVQKPELTDDDVRAGFVSSVLLGTAVCLVVAVGAPLTHLVFTEPQVVPITRLMSLTFVLNGLSATSAALLQRRLRFKAFAWMDTASYVVGYGGVSITLAVMGFGAWSLAVAALAQSAATAVLYYAATRHPVQPIFQWALYRRLYSFGTRISATQFLEFITYNMDTMWVGHYFSASNVGTYTRAFTLVSMPNQYLTTTFTRVLFPAFSRVQRETERLRTAFVPSIMVVFIIGAPMLWGVAAAAPEVVATLLGSQWDAAVPVVAVMALAMPFTLSAGFAGILCDATNHLNVKLIIRTSQIALVLALFAALTRYGIVGIATAYACGQVFVAAALFFVATTILEMRPRVLLRAFTPGAGAGACASVLIGGVGLAGTRAGIPDLLILSGQIVLGLLVITFWMLRVRGGAAWREARARLVGSAVAAPSGPYGRLVRVLDSLASGPKTVVAEPAEPEL